MDAEPVKNLLDSTIIRVDLLKRSKLTSQPAAPDPNTATPDVDNRQIRVDGRHRELLRQPFHGDHG